MQPNAGILIAIAIIVGFVGDAGTQLVTRTKLGGVTGFGLTHYFKQHGKAESMFIASGIMGFFYTLYAFTGLPFRLQYLSIYGIILDLIFRYGKIFPSLHGYYQNSIPATAIIGAVIPFILPLLILKLIDPSTKLF